MAYFNTIANKEIEQAVPLSRNVVLINRLIDRKNHLEDVIGRFSTGSIEIGYTYRGKKYNFEHNGEEVKFIVECCRKELEEINKKIDELNKAE